MTKQEKRDYLKQRGWRRHDRATGKNISQEYWVNPHPTSWTLTVGCGLESAYRAQLKYEKASQSSAVSEAKKMDDAWEQEQIQEGRNEP